MPLQLGLNIKKPASKPQSHPPAPKPGLAFGDDDEADIPPPASKIKVQKPPPSSKSAIEFSEILTFDGSEEPIQPETYQTSAVNPQKSPSPPKPKKQNARIPQGPSMAETLEARSRLKNAEDEDESVFDYDAHYSTSSSAAHDAQRRAIAQKEAQERKPRYMTNMQAAATQRKRDYLRAEDKKLQREREEDPDGADKEAFVTNAYKERQEEARRLEAEEQEKETVEQSRRNKGGMGGFWKNVMEEDEERRKGLGDGAQYAEIQNELDKEKELAEKAKQLNESGANIAINEEGLVTDKRQLLGAGLNIAARKGAGANSLPEKERGKGETKETSNEWDSKERREAKRAMGERHARMVEHQLEEAKKRKAEEEAAELQKREMSSKSKKTDGEISSAKERYLQRKREAEERRKQGLED